MKIIIAGATGMIGSAVVQECLADAAITQIISLVRKKTNLLHPKLSEIIVKDFTNYNEVLPYLSNVTAALFCIGVYTGAVSNELFTTITLHYASAFAFAIKSQSPNAIFCFLSGAGADNSEKSKLPFAKYKGMAENNLIAQNFAQLYIFRPAYIYPTIKRQEPNFAYTVLKFMYPLLKSIYPKGVITSNQLAKAMFIATTKGAPKQILENQDIKNMLKQ